MKQNDAVFSAVTNLIGEINGKAELTKEQKSTVADIVTAGIVDGEVDFSAEAQAKFNTPEKIRGYVVGMVSNHLRKDLRLNGGTKYIIQNPGSRAGAGDAQLKALKALRSQVTDTADQSKLDEAIESRKSEITVKKAVKPVDMSALPEEFKHLLSK